MLSQGYFPKAVKYFPKAIKCFLKAIKYFPKAIKYFPKAIKYFPKAIKYFPKAMKCFPDIIPTFQAYVEFGRAMGSIWLERNSTEWLTHVLALVGNPRAAPSHVDAVYARKCVLFILHSLIGGMMSEKAQIAAAKDMCAIIARQMNALGRWLECARYIAG